MKIRTIGEVRFVNNAIEIKPTERFAGMEEGVWGRLEKKINVSLGGNAWRQTGTETYGKTTWDNQKTEPINIFLTEPSHLFYKFRFWLFKDYLIEVEDHTSMDKEDDIKLHIKHATFKKENIYSKMKKDVERFERFEKQQPIAREQIPEDVRIFVWRRDNGKCVTCGSNRNLEFDHIIPISKGGGNTERNLQILCSDCNKKKSDNI